MDGFDSFEDALYAAEQRETAARSAFARYDVDGSGFIEASELRTLLEHLFGATMRRGELDVYLEREFAKADLNADGKLNFEEFVAYHNGLQDYMAAGGSAALPAKEDGLAEGTGDSYSAGKLAEADDGGLDVDSYAAYVERRAGKTAEKEEEDGKAGSDDVAADVDDVTLRFSPEKKRFRGGVVAAEPSASERAVALRAATSDGDFGLTDVRTVLREECKASETLSKAAFARIFKRLRLFVGQEALVSAMYAQFDRDSSGDVDAAEVEAALSLFATGDADEKMTFCFHAFDADSDGHITREEMARMLRSYVQSSLVALDTAVSFMKEEAEAFGDDVSEEVVSLRSTTTAGGKVSAEEDEEGHVAVSVATAAGRVDATVDKAALLGDGDAYARLGGDALLTSLVDDAFRADVDGNGVLTLDEFQAWAKKSKAMQDVVAVFC
eukprot:PLAT13757.3.p1 GENE.PLAT13757.3~~PLAT13757.3.p1  ORF type:complete len:440 (+),score=182.31 PLAT13757.3:229-1548(+)